MTRVTLGWLAPKEGWCHIGFRIGVALRPMGTGISRGVLPLYHSGCCHYKRVEQGLGRLIKRLPGTHRAAHQLTKLFELLPQKDSPWSLSKLQSELSWSTGCQGTALAGIVAPASDKAGGTKG